MIFQSVIVYTPNELDEDRNPVFDDGVTLDNVYFVYNDGQRNGSSGKEANATASLYYDAINSKPNEFTFIKGQKIDVEGFSYYVNDIKPFFNNKGLHHIEVDLV